MNRRRILQVACLATTIAGTRASLIRAQQPDSSRSPTAGFAGRIRSAMDSTPVQSADVRLIFIDSVVTIHGRTGGDSLDIFADTAKTRITVTDSVGRFAIRRLPAGRYLFDVRRIGYEPLHGALAVDSTILSTTLSLTVVSRVLAKVVVTEASLDRVTQKLDRNGFYSRSHLGLSGTFVERAEIMRRQPQRLEDILSVYGIHGGTVVLDHMPIDYENVRDYPADLVLGVEIYRHSRPTEFNGTRRGPSILSPGGQASSMEALVLVWTFIP